MNQFKPAQVIMLPTETKLAKFQLDRDYNILTILKDLGIRNSQDYVGANLYITSDDEIKEGDWKYNKQLNCITQHSKESEDLYNKLKINPTWCKKIISTTDESMSDQIFYYPDGKEIGGIESYKIIPQPSQQFIEKYIESYNKGEIITDVLVEMEIDEEIAGYEHTYLKVNPKDNTITIKKLKDSWNREEVISNIIKHRDDFLKFKTNSHYNPNDKEIKEWDNNWIKENL